MHCCMYIVQLPVCAHSQMQKRQLRVKLRVAANFFVYIHSFRIQSLGLKIENNTKKWIQERLNSPTTNYTKIDSN